MTRRALLASVVVAVATIGTVAGLALAFGLDARVQLAGDDSLRQLIALGASMAVGLVAGLVSAWLIRDSVPTLVGIARDAMQSRRQHARA